MEEIRSHTDLQALIKIEKATAVYAFTPMCGTCQVASKMLDVIKELPNPFTFVRINANYFPDFAEEQSIESVPCLLLFKDGVCIQKIYAFQSVPFLYETLQVYSD